MALVRGLRGCVLVKYRLWEVRGREGMGYGLVLVLATSYKYRGVFLLVPRGRHDGWLDSSPRLLHGAFIWILVY
jgi:hypothetical protein